MPTIEADQLKRVVIVGGGPAGASCALTLLHGAREQGRTLDVVVLEPKHFGRHFNQCAGVLTQLHLDEMVETWGLTVPDDLVQRELRAYVLHAADDQIVLVPEEGDPPSCATRRVQLDEFLLNEVAAAGGTVLPDRMTDVELGEGETVVYTEGRTDPADAVVGAFGLDPGAASIFARSTAYRPPPCIHTLVAKLHPAGLEPIDSLLNDQIHAFLPRLPVIEFGALIPKGNHISIVVAGRNVRERDLRSFLALPQVSELLPADREPGDHFRGAFPVGPARHYCGPRYLMAGDAAGLVRPFKGGGIKAALATGRFAGLSLLEHGASAQGRAAYMSACRELWTDVWYGRLLRSLVGLLSGPFRLEAVIDVARRSPAMRRVLYDCVSGRTSYRHIFRRELTIPLALRAAWACATWPLRGRKTGSDTTR